MILVLVKRLLSLFVVLFCVVTITFLLIRISPGGPFDGERKIPPAIEKQLLQKYKLDGRFGSNMRGILATCCGGT
jgi:oligopeptide transport system permease protein